MEKNDVVSVECTGLTYSGQGVCRVDNIVVFVDNLLPKEKAEIMITKNKKTFAFAKVVRLLNESDKRVIPTCPDYFKCGGCDLSHMNDELKTNVKYDGVVNNFSKQKLSVNVENFIEDTSRYEYRNKVIMHAQNFAEEIKIGPYKKGSYNVASNNCLMLDNIGMKLHDKVVSLVNMYALSAYDPRTKKGFLKSVVYRKNELGKYLIIFTVNKKSKHLDNVITDIQKRDEVESITITVSKDNTEQGISSVVYGKGSIVYNVSDIKYRVSADSFFQTNTDVMKKMYDVIKDNLNSEDIVLDAYSGVGAISLYVADKVSKVVGIEISNSSYMDAVSNISLNKISNVEFIHGDVMKIIDEASLDFNTIITNPPRTGCSKEFIDFIVGKKFKKAIYMSCNSATLARDLKLLENNYSISKSYVFDMFPHTSHVESIVVLELK